MRFLGALRLLVLGETWTIPVGVAALLLVGAGARTAIPELWRDAGGLVLVAGVIAVLFISVWREAAPRRRGQAPGGLRSGGVNRSAGDEGGSHPG